MRIARQVGTFQILALALLIVAGAITIVANTRTRTSTALSFDPGARLAAATKQQPANQTEEMIWTLQKRIRQTPRQVDALALLGGAYVQRARETGDPSYYDKAEAVFREALNYDPRHMEAILGQGTLALARHQFREALALGQQAQQLNPTVPRVYGVIGDAQIELGMYDEAVQTIQTMVDMRPDLGSLSRVSYLRELHGDLPGAVDAMQQAVSAGGSTVENTLWVRVQLGNLHFNAGQLQAAEREYKRALALLPDYVPAMAALARVQAAQQNYDGAIQLYTEATQRMPLAEYVIALGDVYAKQGNQQQARQQYELVAAIDTLQASNGVNTDLETALFMADHDIDLPASLAKARTAYAARPSIHAADVLAWTLYKTGAYAEAEQYATEALRLGTPDSLKLFHAGMIASAQGQNDRARAYLQQAMQLNPHFSLPGSEQATATLKQLGAPITTEGDK